MDSPLCYIGGKSKLSNIISGMLPKHKSYCEVFSGAAWVFFRKDASQYEILNDKDGDLVSFYRVLQNHLEEFLRQFKWLLSSHEWWDDWNQQMRAGGLTDIQRAARYYYVQRQGFGGKVAGRTWGAPKEHGPRINLVRMEEELSAVHLRLSRVTIENMDWLDFVLRYDKQETVFYLDPPYYNMPYYKHNFYSLKDFEVLAEAMMRLKGKFILSINDHADIRRTFGSFKIRSVKVGYAIGPKRKTGKELLVRNF
jgi:DNA adenine methylase